MEDVVASYAEAARTAAVPVAEVHRVIDALFCAAWDGATWFTLGNGASAALASHMACDLGKGTRVEGCPMVRVVSLADNLAQLTAYGNDAGYEEVFAGQLEALARPGDGVIAISASGESPNVLRAAAFARARGLRVVSLTSLRGRSLRELSDISLCAPFDDVEHIEDVHVLVHHMIVVGLRHRFTRWRRDPAT